jgi:formylglycine-generating enzyme required for sulfatase activity
MRLFISYAHVDKYQVSQLVEILRDGGYEPWFDHQLIPGQNWKKQLLNAIVACDIFVYAMTPESLVSEWCLWELERAAELEKPIIPVRMQTNIKLPAQLQDIQYLDFCDGPTPRVVAQLMRALRVAVTLPVERVPPAPRDPKGVPAQAVEQNINQISGGTVIGQQINVYNTPVGALNLTPSSLASTEKPQLSQFLLPDISKILPPPFEWCEIPAGNVTLEKGGYLKRSTTVDVPAFAIAKYPITNAQFARFIEAGGYQNRDWWTDVGWQTRQKENWTQPRYWTDKTWNGADYPVVGVSWYEAVAFCNWLNSLLNLPSPSAAVGRGGGGEGLITLPTEPQWQRAAQGDDGRRYPWGNDFDKSRCNTEESGIKQTTPVTQYPKGASPYGVMDMSGNVWEWCLTSWKTGSVDVDGTNVRSVRGGSLSYDRRYARAASRNYYDLPYDRNNYRGFRVLAAPVSEL